MKKFFVLVTENAACVCFDTLRGPVVETECGSIEVAQAVAARMNRQAALMEATRRHLDNLRNAAAASVLGTRRGVRYFEPDPFA